MSEKKYQNVHFVGVGGVGLSRLAKYFLLQGKQVSGSDLKPNEFTAALQDTGLDLKIGHKKENLPDKCDLVVYSLAVPQNNPELEAAKARGIETLSHFELLGDISRAFKTIAVAGTNGKSTTTTLIGLVLEEAGMDPTVFVGSAVSKWHGNLRVGRGQYLVVEADELNRQFLALAPFALVITNVEADHLDYYRDLSDIYAAFRELALKVPKEGFIAYNKDDLGACAVMETVAHPRIISFGKNSGSVKLRNIKLADQKQSVDIVIRGKKASFEMFVPGHFNVENALAAIAVSADLNIPFYRAKKVFSDFRGIWRRFQILGDFGRALVVSDYAHHPTSLLATVTAAKEFYPGARVLLVFQPHQRERTNFFEDEFKKSIKRAKPDGLILTEIYDVAGRDAKTRVEFSSRRLFIELSKNFSDAYFAKNITEAEALARKIGGEFDIVLVMGAGDIYKVAESLVTS